MDIFCDSAEYFRQMAKNNACSCSDRKLLYKMISTYIIVTHVYTVIFMG
jgi:hypothetical protein